jgi:hypothetical protein
MPELAQITLDERPPERGRVQQPGAPLWSASIGRPGGYTGAPYIRPLSSPTVSR